MHKDLRSPSARIIAVLCCFHGFNIAILIYMFIIHCVHGRLANTLDCL